MGLMRIGWLEARVACVDQPDRPLLPKPERHAIDAKGQNPVRPLDVFGIKPAGIAVHRHEGRPNLRRLEEAQHLPEQRTGKGRGRIELRRLRRDRSLRKPEQRRSVEGKGAFEIDLLHGKQTVALGIERPAIGLADHAAHGEHHHVAGGLSRIAGKSRESAGDNEESKQGALHGCSLYPTGRGETYAA
jgi:hypothetical protein